MTREQFVECLEHVRAAAYLAESGNVAEWELANVKAQYAIQTLWAAVTSTERSAP